MGFDSTTDLLFRIGASSEDAEANLHRFRALLGKDLESVTGEFSSWASKTFGSFTTLQAAAIGTGAIVGAGLLAAGAAASHATEKYLEYVGEVARAAKVTGISTEEMSKLRYAAEMVGVKFDELTPGMARFTSAVVQAAHGSEEHLKTFQKLGLTQEQLKAGERDMGPLLSQVADKMAGLANKTDQVTLAREMYGRSGDRFLGFLKLGAEGIKELTNQMDKHLIVTKEDVKALKEHTALVAQIKAMEDAVNAQVGRFFEPIEARFKVGFAGLIKTITTEDWEGLLNGNWIHAWRENAKQISENAEKAAAATVKMGNTQLKEPAGLPKIKADFSELSAILDQVNSKLSGSDEAKAEEEIQKIVRAMGKAVEGLRKQQKEGTLQPGVFDREMKAWDAAAERLPALYQQMMFEISQKRQRAGTEALDTLGQQLLREGEQTRAAKEAEWTAEMDALANRYRGEKDIAAEAQQAIQTLVARIRKAGMERINREEAEAAREAAAELEKRALEQSTKDLAAQHRALDREIDELRESYRRKFQLTAANEARLAEIRQAGHARIDADNQAAFGQEMARLQEQLARVRAEQASSAERIREQYDADVAKFSAAEEKKTLSLATSLEQRAAIAGMYAAIRSALLAKEQTDLQTLRNSQGWTGVFGSGFAQMIRGNEALTKQWASSTNQSLLMVRVTMEGLREVGQQAFAGLARGMGQNIASAVVYKKSIGEAMRSAVASTLESISAESATWAIYSTALGFLRLAQHDPAGAAAAFTSAAIWGSVGVAAAIGGRLVAPAQGGAGAAGELPAGSGGGVGSTNDAGAPSSGRGQIVQVIVQGHIFGISGAQELAAVLNDAVLTRDVVLTATNTKNGQVLVR